VKVLFVIDSLRQGGAERSTALMAKSFKEAGWQVEFAIFNSVDAVYQDVLTAAGVPLHVLGWGGLVEDAFKLRDFYDLKKPDLVMFCLYRTSLRVRLLRLLRPETRLLESLVSFAHNVPFRKKGVVGYAKQFVRRKIARISMALLGQHYHAVSSAVAEYYTSEFGVPTEKVRVIYRGRESPNLIGPEEKARIRRDIFNVSPEEILVVSVGRMEPDKNPLCLVKCAQVIQMRGIKPSFVFSYVGRAGSASAAVHAAIQAAGVQSSIRDIGFRDDVTRIIQAADAFVMPSHSEGLPGAVIEAMSVGLPVFASNIPALREVSGGSFGFHFFDPDRAEELANLLCEFACKKEEFLLTASSNVAVFKERYLAPQVMQLMRDHVQRLVDNRREQ
jgi:L-malate glycosyltransferase